MEKLIINLVIVLMLSACATTTPEEKIAEQKIIELSSKLRVGMSFEQVKAIHDNLGNCQGSKKSYMQCQWVFLGTSSSGSPLESALAVGLSQGACVQKDSTGKACETRPLPGSNPEQKNKKIFDLFFEKNKLKRWKEQGK